MTELDQMPRIIATYVNIEEINLNIEERNVNIKHLNSGNVNSNNVSCTDRSH